MLEKFVELIINCIYDLSVDNISKETDKLIDRIKKSIFKSKLKRHIKKDLNIDFSKGIFGDAFLEILKAKKIINNLVVYYSKRANNKIPQGEFLESQTEIIFSEFDSKGIDLYEQDKDDIKRFIERAYDSIVTFSYNQLSAQQKTVLNTIEDDLLNCTKKLIGEIGSLKDLSTEDSFIKAYEFFASRIDQGKILEIKGLLQVLGNQVGEKLKACIDLKIFFFENSNLQQITFKIDEVLKQKYASIKKNIIQDIVLLNIDNKDVLRKVYEEIEEGEFRRIIDAIIDEKWEEFYTIHENDENKQKQVVFALTKKFSDEIDFKNKIILHHIYSDPRIIIDESSEIIDRDELSFYDELIMIHKKVEMMKSGLCNLNSQKIKEQLYEWKEKLLFNRELYNNLNDKIGVIFGSTIYGIALLLEDYNIDPNHDLLRKNLYENIEIARSDALIEVEKNHENLSVDYIIDKCLQCDSFVILNNYLIKTNANSLEIINAVDKCKIALEKDAAVFMMYVQAVYNTNGNDEALKVLNDYESTHGNSLEFWVLRLRMDGKCCVKNIYEKWEKGLGVININTAFVFIEKLLFEGYIEEAKRVVDLLESMNVDQTQLRIIKAKVSLYDENELTALNQFLDTFNECPENDFVLGSIISLSLNNNRDIEGEVIRAAENSLNPEVLRMVALAEKRAGNTLKAKFIITKSLLRATNEEIFSTYFSLCGFNDESKNTLECGVADADVCITLCNKEGKIKRICIHRDNVLPSDPYIWEDAEHIYSESAIKRGLIRKKVGDSVRIEEEEYIIQELFPVDVFLFRVCMRKLVDSGTIKQFSMSEKELEEKDFSNFTNWLKENTVNDVSNILDYYNDFSNIAIPLWSIGNKKRLSNYQVIEIMMEDPTIVIRGYMSEPNIDNLSKYIISYSAIVILHKLGINEKWLKKDDIYILESLKNVIRMEKDEVIASNNRNTVATLGVIDEHPFISEDSEETKIQNMQAALNLNQYVEGINTINNQEDIEYSGLMNASTIKEIFGISDYDALATVVRKEGSCLVTSEPIYYAMSLVDEKKYNAINIIDFLCKIEIPIDDLIIFIVGLIDHQFQVFITPLSFKYILEQYENCSDIDKKEGLLAEWIEILARGNQLGTQYGKRFKDLILELASMIYPIYKDEQSYIWKYFLKYAINYTIEKKQQLEENKVDK